MLGLFLAIVMPMLQPEVLFLNAAEVISHLTSISPYSAVALLYTAKYFLDGALLLLFVRYAEKEKLNSVGIKRVTFFDAISALATCLLAFSVNSFGIHFWSSQAVQHSNQGRHLFLLLPRTLRFSYDAAASFAEEIGIRAYIIERFTMLTGELWVGGCLSVAVSLSMHFYVWGAHGGIERLPSLLLLAGLYLWRRNLGASVLAHFLIDAELSMVLMLPKSIIHQVAFLPGLGH